MIILLNFLVAFIFSFIGTIPPGTLNLNILQLGLEGGINIAWRFAIAASLVEYPYAWIAIHFERLITSAPWITGHLQLATAIVMTVLGLMSLLAARKPTNLSRKFTDSGFRRGLILGILNPLALPFWLGTTAYLNSQHWIDITSPSSLHAYLFGVSLGALALLMVIAYLARYVVRFVNEGVVKVLPGAMLLILGIYAFIQYFIS